MGTRTTLTILVALVAFAPHVDAQAIPAPWASFRFEEQGVARHPSPVQQLGSRPTSSLGNVMFGTAIAGAMGALVGGVIGSRVGVGDQSLAHAFTGARIGMWLAGAGTAAEMSRQPGLAVVGSLAGTFLAWTVLETGSVGPAVLVLAPLTHGWVTALFTGAGKEDGR